MATATRRSGLERRQEIAEGLRREANLIRSTIRREIQELRPMGLMSDWGVVLNLRPKSGVPVGTPFGVYVFAKARRPAAQTLDRWQKLHKDAEALQLQELELLWCTLEPGQTTGNQRHLEQGRALAKRRLLDRKDLAFLRQLESFWKRHPKATWGVVAEDGTIRMPEDNATFARNRRRKLRS